MENRFWIAALVRLCFVEHFVKKNSQGPKISLKALKLMLQLLRRHVHIGTRHSAKPLLVIDVRSPAEVAQFDTETFGTDKNIFWLEVSHDHSLRMKVLNSLNALSKNILNLRDLQFLSPHEGKQVGSFKVLQDQIYISAVLEVAEKVNYLRVFKLKMNLNFFLNVH